MKTFHKSFTQQESISPESIQAATRVLESGRLHRYNNEPGELSETDLLEIEFAEYMGTPYCLACSSGGYALHIAMRAAGVTAGDKVLCNAFTLAPVPGAINNCGAIPVLVDVDDSYCIDLTDLDAKASSSKAMYFLLSHMRGHIADMDKIMEICDRYALILIEDCAHTMGASWNGVKSGNFGDVACFSTQTYKHINSGEGGLLTSANEDIMAKAVIYSGSYMLYGQHQAAPSQQTFDAITLDTPNYSGRMDNLRAAILRPQLAALDEQCERWNSRYLVLEETLRTASELVIPARNALERYVASSIQFSVPSFSQQQILDLVSECERRGVALKWFGDAKPKGYTSRYDSWQYLDDLPKLTKTQTVLSTLLDMRIPLTFTISDCELIGEIIVEAAAFVADSKTHV